MSANHTGALSLGLEGVIAAETRLSKVGGAEGELIFAGYPVDALAGHHPYEAVAHLLQTGALPTEAELEALRRSLAQARAAAFERLGSLGDALDNPSGMGALRGALAHLEAPDGGGDPLAVIGAAAVFAAAWVRRRAGLAPIPPSLDRAHGPDFLHMATGEDRDDRGRALDAYLCTVMDHGLNASTFTARVIASTGSDLISSVCGAVGALKGPLHGGAPGPVLDMLDAIGVPEAAEAWIRGELAAGRRIMGMGHRVYRVRDPRGAVLETQVRILAESGAGEGAARLALAQAVERAAEAILRERYPARDLKANVEFFTAVLLEGVRMPREAFTLTFAVGRVVGWCAHVAEERQVKKIVRPLARYVGPVPVRA